MAWKVVCSLCGQDHSGHIESYTMAVCKLADVVGEAAARGLPDDLLRLLSVQPQEYVYSLGQWVHPDDAAKEG